MINPTRAQALRASRAVTLAGALSLGCGGATPSSEDNEAVEQLEESRPTLEVAPAATGDDLPSEPTITIGPDAVVTPVGDPTSAAEQADTPLPAECTKELDGLCPPECNTENDADCCEGDQNADGWMWCTFSTEWGCNCAVEGPFAPPRFV